jgi:hypothetical protein
MRKFFFSTLLLTIVACSESKTEEITLDDLKQIESTKEYVDEKPEINSVNQPSGTVLTAISDTLIGKASWQSWDTLFYPQRFGPSKVETWICTNSVDSLSLVELGFSDSLKTFNAFYNWLDCFGPKCRTIQLLESFKVSGRNSLILVKSKSILFVESNHKISIEKVISGLEKKKEKQVWDYILHAVKGKKAQWYRANNGQLTELK